MGRSLARLDTATGSHAVVPVAFSEAQWASLGDVLKPTGVPSEIRDDIAQACDTYLHARQYEVSTATVQDARKRLAGMREKAQGFQTLALQCHDHATDEASSVTNAVKRAMKDRRVTIGLSGLQLGTGFPTQWHRASDLLPEVVGPALAFGINPALLLDLARQLEAGLAEASAYYDQLEEERFGFEKGPALDAWLLAMRALFEGWNKANPDAKSYGIGGLSGGTKPTPFAVFLHALNRTLPADLAEHVQSPATMGERLKAVVARTPKSGGSIGDESNPQSNPLP